MLTYTSSPGARESLNSPRIADPEAVSQPEEVSNRASELILTSLATFPESTRSIAIVADRVMGAFGPRDHASTGIGIRELAQITPDADHCAQTVNRLHERFGVACRLTPTQALNRVFSAATSTLDMIRAITLEAAASQSVPTPVEIQATCIRESGGVFSGSWSIDTAAASVLEDFLAKTDGVREVVAARIKAEADELRARSREQQLWAMGKLGEDATEQVVTAS